MLKEGKGASRLKANSNSWSPTTLIAETPPRRVNAEDVPVEDLSNTEPVRIAGAPAEFPTDVKLTGRLDELELFNRALTAQEIAVHQEVRTDVHFPVSSPKSDVCSGNEM